MSSPSTNDPPGSIGVTAPVSSTTTTSSSVSGAHKLTGLHDWLSIENRRVKQWWAARSGTDLHKIYLTQLQDTDGKLLKLFIT